MEQILILGVLALLGIAASHALSPRVGIAAPLLLVALGVLASVVPAMPEVEVDPEIILAGVLPPLLYAAAVQIPATDFRRELRSISGLSLALVLISTALLGVFFHWILGLSWPWALALGALVSPTDPVATAIIKRLGVNPRVTTVLEGESMLNDAVALVLLRAAVAASAASVTFWSVSGVFVMALTVAVIIGWAVGRLNLWVRSHVKDTTVNTVITFTVPFIASIPAEAMGASGLVAAVVAGLVTGNGAARVLSPQHRVADRQTWHALELVLEGAVYLILGLELIGVIEDVQANHQGVGRAAWIALAALVLSLVIRAGFVAPLMAGLRRSAATVDRRQERIAADQAQLADLSTPPPLTPLERLSIRLRPGRPEEELHRRIHARLVRAEADATYQVSSRLGWRDGTLIVWSGMRGVVTIAAAQTLPADAPERSLLILIAFVVAVVSLGVQGGTAATLVRFLKPDPGQTPQQRAQERVELQRMLGEAADDARDELQASADELDEIGEQLAVIHAQREVLLEARMVGSFTSATLQSAMRELDADQIRLEL
ncbi:sodium:proton antiporter [Demequina capsici]|uniref:Sodium:proton antiporter n=1 Tax=Demequina capsici TaxID=3075620 RepID=A0AA96J996_9MICO|nr:MULTISPECIES: sodium:proton antiporter [unclassified Demequina]WNM23282.1 sodium:proton antiporter [Demequina sp. OYTSA14]WNM26160.1 sodium:proton antiporter [Demequina sp. PMTSA13]